MSDVLANVAKNYGDLEKKHFETTTLMKEVEEKARTESERRKKNEGGSVQMPGKGKKSQA